MCLGIPGQVVALSDPQNQLAIVDISGVRRPVNMACIVDADHPLEQCVGCLLYTSPSPRDLSTSRMPSSA